MSAIDHKAEAEALTASDWNSDIAAAQMTEALVHATLYLAEQQRIANLIALGQFRVGITDLPHLRHLAVQADGPDGLGPSDHIREGLGLS